MIRPSNLIEDGKRCLSCDESVTMGSRCRFLVVYMCICR